MLKIRLQRVGKVHEPVYRLVLTDSKNGPKSGKFLEILGNFDSRKSEEAKFEVERIKQLIANGAQLSPTVHNLFISRKIIEGKKINKLPKKTVLKKEGEEAKKEETPVEEKVEEKKEEVAEEVKAETEVAA